MYSLSSGPFSVIEEMLVGEEASFFARVDGKTALALVTAQDQGDQLSEVEMLATSITLLAGGHETIGV